MSDETLSDESSARFGRGSRRVWIVCLLSVAGVLLVWTAAYAAAGSGVPRGTTVLGVSIGGLDPAQAQRRLDRALADRTAEPVAVRVGDDDFEVDPVRAGLGVDVAATVDRAEGRTWNPAGLWRALTGGGPVEPVTTAEDAALAAAMASLAERADEAPRDGDVVFEGGEAAVVEPRPGRALEQEDAAAALRSAYLRDEEPVELPVEQAEPGVGAEEAQRALEQFGRPALAAPVELVVGDTTVVIEPGILAPTLSMKADDEEVLTPRLDGAALKKALAPELEGVESKARNASIRIADGEPRIRPARNGTALAPPQLAKAVLAVLPRTSERVARVELTASEADLTTAEARALGIKEAVGEFTTTYPYAAYRVTNIGRAAELIDDTLLQQGETFSLNGIVGERTVENGFAKGTIIKNGRFATELGGGVSQVATTAFNAMFFAGLEDVEHKPHSFYISRYPEGREATVAWPVLDLKFRNNSPYGVLVQAVHEEGSLTVRMWSTKVYDIEARKSERSRLRYGTTRYDPSPECVPQSAGVGFDVTVTRIFTEDGDEERREKFFTRYNPADEVLCRPAPQPKPQPRPEEAEPGADAAPEDDRETTPAPRTPRTPRATEPPAGSSD